MLPFLKQWLTNHNQYLKPIYLIGAWVFILSLITTLWAVIKDIVKRSRQMHQIPCSNCQYFTHNYHLKCTIQPRIANTEQALNCSDFKQYEQL
jgi:hypothetical protein